MASFLADKVIVFDGIPAKESSCTSPEGLVSGMNKFLKQMDITFRRDPTSQRPRINKYESQKDQEQKLLGNYFLLEETKNHEEKKEEEKSGKKKPGSKATTDSTLGTIGASGLPEIESHFKKQKKDSDEAHAKGEKKSKEEEKE